MNKFSLIFISIIFSILVTGCYDPTLNEQPFVCGGTPGNPECPEGYGCYGGMCLTSKPACWVENFFGSIGGFADADFEPNNHPDLAYKIACDHINDPMTCPAAVRYETRTPISNLAICGEGDIDIYKIYLQVGETLQFDLIYSYQVGRDLDIEIFRMDSGSKINESMAASTNDNEEITFGAVQTTAYYYIMVYGKSMEDINAYAINFKIDAPVK
jgi:hypothetical protein